MEATLPLSLHSVCVAHVANLPDICIKAIVLALYEAAQPSPCCDRAVHAASRELRPVCDNSEVNRCRGLQRIFELGEF
jgi:hypothetical protein